MNNGIRLEEQRIDDMLDMIHYFFETDAVGEEESQKAKLRMRRTVYEVLYLRDYTWQQDEDGLREFGTQEVASGGSSGELTHKPYVPPTPVNPNAALPYGNVLDAPLG